MESKNVLFQSDEDGELMMGGKIDSMPMTARDELKLSRRVELLLAYFKEYGPQHKRRRSAETIRVGEVLSTVALYYERLRNAIDYREEHLQRRNAIERILKRKLWSNNKVKKSSLADSILRELIWAGYAQNDSIDKSKIVEINSAIDKFLQLNDLLATRYKKHSEQEAWRVWFLGIASSEIEEIIDPYMSAYEVIGWVMYSWFMEKYEIYGTGMSEQEIDLQVNIAVYRGLFKTDVARVRYHLLKHYEPDWDSLEATAIMERSGDIFSKAMEIESRIHSETQPKLYRFIQKQSPPFKVLTEVVSKDPDKMESILKGPDKLEREIEAVCAVKYQLIRSKVNKGIARSIIYIFVTKVLLAVVVELPYEYYFLGHIKYLSLTANLLIPPSLMFFLGLTIKKPGEENTRRIVETTHDIVYETEKQPKIRVNMGRNSKQTVAYRAFVVIYILLFMVCFSSFSYLLYRLNFGLVGGLIFFMFLSLVLLFGYRVRFAASEYKVTTEREGFLSHVLSNLTLPFLNLGVWLSSRMSQFNFIVVFLDFIIEAPLKATMEGVDRWTAFIKEKREEVVEVPAD